jgi:hypothetical protein
MLSKSEHDLLASVVRINMTIMAGIAALFGGAILWLATAALLMRGGEDIGKHLSLLSVFLPGYEVSWFGAWIGLTWGLVIGGVSGALMYWSYAKALRASLVNGLIEPLNSTPFRQPVFLMSGAALGVAMGALGAFQLFLTTNWLVVRGTAHLSKNAALLANYLPGYTVSFFGSLIGSVELFAVIFVASIVFAATYNFVAKARIR